MLSADYLKINAAAPQDPAVTSTNDPSKVASAVSSLTPEPEAPESTSPLAMTIPGMEPTEPPTTEESTDTTPASEPQPQESVTESAAVESPEDRPDPHDNHYDLHEPEDALKHMQSLSSTTQDGIFTDPQQEPPQPEPEQVPETPQQEPTPEPAPEPVSTTSEPPKTEENTDAKNQFSSLLKDRIEAEKASLTAAEEEEARLLTQAAEATKKVKALREHIKKLSSLEDLDPDILDLVRSVSAEKKPAA